MRKKENLEIDGETFTVRPLNVGEIMEIASMEANPTSMIAYIVMAGTLTPRFRTIDDIPLNVCLKLAEKIQELTMMEMPKPEEDETTNPFIV